MGLHHFGERLDDALAAFALSRSPAFFVRRERQRIGAELCFRFVEVCSELRCELRQRDIRGFRSSLPAIIFSSFAPRDCVAWNPPSQPAVHRRTHATARWLVPIGRFSIGLGAHSGRWAPNPRLSLEAPRLSLDASAHCLERRGRRLDARILATRRSHRPDYAARMLRYDRLDSGHERLDADEALRVIHQDAVVGDYDRRARPLHARSRGIRASRHRLDASSRPPGVRRRVLKTCKGITRSFDRVASGR